MKALSLPQPKRAVLSVVHNNSDEELLRLISLKDDRRSFDILFHRYYDALCRHVFGMLHCESMSEEIVLEVFARIWRKRSGLTIGSKVKYYLFTAVRNQTIDFLRKQIRQRPYKYELNRDFVTNYASPDEQLIGKEMEEKINKAINSLPPQGKYIFQLSRNEGLKYREIAEKLEISIKTVETHMRRSLIHLRKEVYGD